MLKQKLTEFLEENKHLIFLKGINIDITFFQLVIEHIELNSYFIDPYIIAEKINMPDNYQDVIKVLLFFTNDEITKIAPLTLQPYMYCIDENCQEMIFPSKITNKYINSIDDVEFYCPECDVNHEKDIYDKHMRFFFRVNSKIIIPKEPHSPTDLDIVKGQTEGLKLSPSSESIESTRSIQGGLQIDDLKEQNETSSGDYILKKGFLSFLVERSSINEK